MTSVQVGSQFYKPTIPMPIPNAKPNENTADQVGTPIFEPNFSTPIPNAAPSENTAKPNCFRPSPEEFQTHVHEFEGSTKIAEEEEEPHNHRFAGVSSQVIPSGDSHVHAVFTNTDFFEDHLHEVAGVSGLAIDVGDNKHVHFVRSITTLNDGHFHEFQFASLIQSPMT